MLDLREKFRKYVMNYFAAEYFNGRTPNPCVRCNQKIKFGELLDFAQNLGADYLATGHYARIVFENDRYKLKRALDPKKDQSYVLYHLTPNKLAKILMPLGNFTKEQTRKLAEELNISTARKPDSQEVCFVPDGDYKIFLREFLPNSEALQSGKIVDSTGQILGEHDGVANYTIGQRKGLGIYSSRALYVKKIDVSERKIVVDTNENLYSSQLRARNVSWIYKPTLPKKLTAKIRYGIKFAECFVTEEENFLNVEFTEPQRAVTPGQSIVFYDGDEVLGGAIIEGSY